MYTDSWAAQSGLDLKGATLEDRRVGVGGESCVLGFSKRTGCVP